MVSFPWSEREISLTMLIGCVFATLLNVIYHVAATIGLHEYAPGVVTAVLVILPVMGYLHPAGNTFLSLQPFQEFFRFDDFWSLTFGIFCQLHQLSITSVSGSSIA